jgi:predicted DNA binding protein
VTLVADFRVPAESFALERTLAAVPDAVVEIDRVVSAGGMLTPYFWVSGCAPEAFAAAAVDDPTFGDLHQLDVFEEAVLYRAEWTGHNEPILFAYREIGAVIVEATGQDGTWELRMRFDDTRRLTAFRDHCADNGVTFELVRLYDPDADHVGAEYGLTAKQADALTTAWRLGYFETPRRATLADLGTELGVSRQAAARRVRRANQTWIENALAVTPPERDPEAPT